MRVTQHQKKLARKAQKLQRTRCKEINRIRNASVKFVIWTENRYNFRW